MLGCFEQKDFILTNLCFEQMHRVVALVAFIFLSILSLSSPSWSLAISNGASEEDVENLFQYDAQQTANNNDNT